MINSTKILYIGALRQGETCYDRMRVMRDIGLNVVPFDTSSYAARGSRVARSLRHRLKLGIFVRKLNHDLLQIVQKSSDLTNIWFDKATLIWPETLRRIKKITHIPLIHYTPDPQILFHRSRHFIESIPLYDMLFTTKPFELDLYREFGARSVHLTYQAYDRNRFYPREPSKQELEKYYADVLLIGHYEKHRAECIKAIVDTKIQVKVWGQYWKRYAKWHPWARNVVMGTGVISDQYCIALSSAAICLGLLSKFIPESTTTRSVEIPACGAFMLAERTKEHLDLFEEGQEAEFFSSTEELVEKVHYYLKNPRQRKQIAAAGRRRCVDAGYSFQDRLKDILEKVREIK